MIKKIYLDAFDGLLRKNKAEAFGRAGLHRSKLPHRSGESNEIRFLVDRT